MRYIRLALVPAALLCVLIVRVCARFGFLIRFGQFWSGRLGHLAAHNELYLCERDAGMQKGFDIWTHRGTIANRQIARMFNRLLHVDYTRLTALVIVCNRLFQGHEKHWIETAQYDRDIHGLYEKYPCHVKFTAGEHRKGKSGLRRLGIPEGAKWVCLIVRDAAYLPALGYHSYRDSDVDTYVNAAVELANRGYYVLRMGAAVAKPMIVKHSRIIDYATSGKRTDFMDVYLGAHCAFCVSNGAGFDAIPIIFRRPVCFVNIAPIEYLCTFVNPSLGIWKHHIRNGKRMTPQEIYDSGAGEFMAAQQFVDAGITLEDNSRQEIVDVCKEMADWVSGKTMYLCGNLLSPTEARQRAFWRSFPMSNSPYNGHPLHGQIRMRIGAQFLKGYDVSTDSAPRHQGAESR